MDRLLFLVAKDQPDLWDQFSKEFSGKDVSVVVDRRSTERRHRAEACRIDRRHRERRGRAEVDREVRSRGFSVISVEPGKGQEPVRGQGNPNAIREVLGYIRERFRHYTTVSSWDIRREGQSLVIFNSTGRAAHRLLFQKEFLDYYGAQMPDQIPRLLDEWKLPGHLETSGSQLITVSTYGISVDER